MKIILKGIVILISVTIGLVILIIIGYLSLASYKSSDAYVSKVTKQAVDANDSSICQKIMVKSMEDDSPISDCYYQVAIQNKNLNACPINEWMCLSAYFEYYKTSDQTLCRVITDENQRDMCYLEQSNVVHDSKLCSLIRPTNNMQSSCYINIHKSAE